MAITCGKCSHWTNGRRVAVAHATVADVRACHATPAAPSPAAMLSEAEASAARTLANVAPSVPTVPAGRYALRSEDGKITFYVVDHGREGTRWAGRVFLSVQASDETHPIRNAGHRESILALIGADVRAALALYGHEIGRCGMCGRTLTDEASRAAGIGPVCAGKL